MEALLFYDCKDVNGEIRLAKLTYKEKKELPDSEFAVPEERKYPIENAAHARNALARVSQFGTPKEKKQVCEAVAKRYPSIHETHCTIHQKAKSK